uniref:Uncharacterized protein n=1 Tax=Lepeophtheirus salmonis TaxID=72036 RepID=A0A0K2U5C8_LEPSM
MFLRSIFPTFIRQRRSNLNFMTEICFFIFSAFSILW